MGRNDAGPLLREWRTRRRYSQLDLSVSTGVSAKHLSYVETGRSRPSPEMVVHLCQHLDVPLRDRNTILLAAGHAPQYERSSLDASGDVTTMVDLILAAQPFPTIVVDHQWNLVAANDTVSIFLVGVADHLVTPPANVVRLSLAVDGLRPRIVNFAEYASHVLARIRRIVNHSPDPVLSAVLDEFAEFDIEPSTLAEGVVLPLVLDVDGAEVRMFSTIATFGAPREVTVSELAIETFYPADAASAAVMARYSHGQRSLT